MKQRVYATENELLAAIDRTFTCQAKSIQRAEAQEAKAQTLIDGIKQQNPDELDDAAKQFYWSCVNEVRKIRDRAQRIRNYQSRYQQKLNRLKRTLAAFRTEPMAFVDRAVVAQ